MDGIIVKGAPKSIYEIPGTNMFHRGNCDRWIRDYQLEKICNVKFVCNSKDIYIKEVEKYIKGTYDQHYVGKKEVQTIDVWETLGSIDTTCRDTAIKYLMRYGKKGGHNRKDLLKAVHYIVLLAHFTEGDSNGN